MAETRTRLTELPVDPHSALAVHFGMLLGVSDLELLAANPRGKLRLHNAWLHGEGVVYGFRVTFEPLSREVRVAPGLALDSNGRELHLGGEVCVNLDAWFAEHKDRLDDDGGPLDVAVRYQACLNRPVPALAGECDDSPESAYSRVLETVRVDLEKPAERPPTTFLRLRRALFGQAAPGDPQSIQALMTEDSLDLAPSEDDPPVVVARIRVTVADGRPDIAAGVIDHAVRRVHLPNTLVTEALAAYAPIGAHVDVTNVEWVDDEHVSIGTSAPLYPETVVDNVVAHLWSADRWKALTASGAVDGGRLIVAMEEGVAAGGLVRIVVRGSGPTPVVADVGGRPTALAGDVVLTLERS